MAEIVAISTESRGKRPRKSAAAALKATLRVLSRPALKLALEETLRAYGDPIRGGIRVRTGLHVPSRAS